MPATRVPTAISESNKHPGPPFGGPGCLYSGKGRSGRMISAPTRPRQMPRSFKGMAPMAARRAHPVQRSSHQGLPGNPDACRPRRGSACNMSARKTSGDARSVFALPVRRTAAMSPRIGGPREGGAPRPFFSPISLGRNGGRRRRPKLRIVRFRAGPKAHSLHCALAPVAALRFPGQTGPPIAPLLFPGSFYPPLAALRRETLPTEPASLGFGGGPVIGFVTGAAAPWVARIGITPQTLKAAALYRVRPPGRRRCHAPEKAWQSRRLSVGRDDSARRPCRDAPDEPLRRGDTWIKEPKP